jgi:hypothetical protein
MHPHESLAREVDVALRPFDKERISNYVIGSRSIGGAISVNTPHRPTSIAGIECATVLRVTSASVSNPSEHADSVF